MAGAEETSAPTAEMAPAAVAEADFAAAAEVSLATSQVITVDDSPPPPTGGCLPRSSRSANPRRGQGLNSRLVHSHLRLSGERSPPPPPRPFAPWRPDIECVLGRQLAETDRAVNPEVVAALGRACALPQDMARWAKMDNESLLLSSMRSLVATGMERLDAAAACAASWAVDREELQRSLAAKEAMLVEEASRNAGLVADLDEAQPLVEHFKEQAKKEVNQSAHLSFELDEVWLTLSRQDEDLDSLRGANRRLTSQRNMARGELEMALRGKAAELESALAEQEAKLKDEYLAEHNATMNEEVGKLAAYDKAQLPGI
ncbi:hypothetical protein AAC387_Pa03g1389 [Persea americana]